MKNDMPKLKKILFIFRMLALTVAVAVLPACEDSSLTDAEKQAIIDEAIALQTEGGVYSADVYGVTKLITGDLVYGMRPGQTVFYTNRGTVNAGGGSYKAIYRLLQIRPHPVFGYRTLIGEYVVLEDMHVACGWALANRNIVVDGKSEFLGDGGGFQYVIVDFENNLHLIREINLHE